MKNNRDLDGKTVLARDLRALHNFNITDRVLVESSDEDITCRANRTCIVRRDVT